MRNVNLVPATASRTVAAVLLAALAVAGCNRLDNLWSAATAPGPDAAPLDAALVVPLDPSVPPRADDDSGTGAYEPEPPARDAGPGAVDAPAVADVEATADAPAATDGPAPVRITALAFRTGIVEAPQGSAHWIGYLRAGAQIDVVRGPVGNDGCPARRDTRGAGWYEVAGGGFMCVGPLAALTESLGDRPITRRLPNPPDLDASMPFTYGRATRAAAVYRWLPSEADERVVEPERFAPRAATADPDAGVADGGATDGAVADAQVRIEDLEGAAGTPLLRRALRGMYMSLHRQMQADSGGDYWHTQSGGYIRSNAVATLHDPGYFQGVTLDATHHLPMAFALSATTFTFQSSGRSMARVSTAPRLTAFQLTDEPPVTVGRDQYFHTTDGFFVRSRQVRVVTRHDPPVDLAPGEHWIDVNLDHQSAVAYEGVNPVYVTVMSSGRRNERNPDENYETVQGGFRILSKHVATTMDGNSANDGPYSIEDVPWVMYFEGSFALHGAFWHNGFGAMHSHGCVNMSPPDARWFFNWTEPHVPVGWHGAYANAQHPGTRVYVHYDEQPLGTRGGPDHVPQH